MAAGEVAALTGGAADTIAFLQRTLPPEQPGAFYFVSEQDAGGGWKDHPVATIAEAARLVLQFDAAGANAYFALATFAPDRGTPSRVRRRQEHAISLRALFLDVDVSKPGAYATQGEARAELKRFCSAAGLPLPRSISSGKGLHLNWVLNEPVPRADWQKAANNLAVLCSALAFKVDPACTTDAARVLRPVGTHWRKKNKGGPLPVRLLEDAAPVAFDSINALLSDACRRHGAVAKVSAPASAKGLPSRINWEFEVHYLRPPANADLIADNCAQLRDMRGSGGCITEPRWHACIGVLVHADNGDEVAHEWSSGDPRYTRAETEGKITRARDFGPTTCARFAEIYREGCANCTHNGQITSPVQLGNVHRIAPEALQTGESLPAMPAAPLAQWAGGAMTAPYAAQPAALAFGAPAATVEPQRLFDLSEANVRDFLLCAPSPRRYLLKDCLPAGKVGAIIAPGGTGKSQFVLQLAISVASGLPLASGGWEVGESGGVLALFAEDDKEEVGRRLYYTVKSIESNSGTPNIVDTLDGRLFVRSMVAEDNLMTAPHPKDTLIYRTPYADKLIGTAQGIPNLKLIIIDPASRYNGGDENKAGDMTRFVEVLEYVSKATGAAVLVIHHANKASMQGSEQTQSAARGSSALSDGIRWQMNLSTMTKDEARACDIPEDQRRMYLTATMTKNNYAAPQPPVFLRRTDNGVLVEVDLAERARHKEGTTILRIVQKIAATEEQFSARSFADAFCGERGIFEMGQNALVRCVNQAIGHGYLKKDAKKRGALSVTDVGKAIVQAGALAK